MVQPKRCITACILALSLVFGAAGCAMGSAAGLTRADVKASSQPNTDNNEKMAGYLKASRSDLDLIDDIMADKDISLLEDDSGSDEELTADVIAKYETVLTGYMDRIEKTLGEIDKRAMPDQSDLKSFRAAEKDAFQTLDSILQEYSQTLSYAGSFLDVIGDLSDLQNVKGKDLQAIYDKISATIGDAIKKLQAASVPSFIASFNKDLIDTLKQMDDAVFYALSAASTGDPLRSDAAGYLMDILSRRADKIDAEFTKDLELRQKKLQEDAKEVQKTSESLKSWLDTNIANFGN